MGFQWSELPEEVTVALEKQAVALFSSMIAQGLSNSVYGFGLMKLNWNTVSQELRTAVYEACISLCSARTIMPAHNAQAVTNIVYGLSECGAKWDEFPFKLQQSFLGAIVACSPHFKAVEISHLIYG